MIPKQIYIYYENTPGKIRYTNKWRSMNPDYGIHMISYESCKNIMKNQFSKIFYKTFNNINEKKIRLDFFKFCILYHYGGIFIENDLEPLCSIDSFFKTDFVLCKAMEENTDNICSNQLIACNSESPLIKQILIDYIEASIDGHRTWNPSIWNLSKKMEQVITFETINGWGIYNRNNMMIQVLQQHSGNFFYDAYFIYNNKRIMNDSQKYFV